MATELYPNLVQAFQNTTVLKKGDYPYPISPFAAVNKPIEPILFSEIAQAVKKESSFSGIDLIITFESSGNQIAAIISQTLNIPCLIARKKKFDLDNEVVFSVATNYDSKDFYLYGNINNKRILLVDDVIAGGSTMKNAVVALQNQGAIIQALFVVAAKNNTIGRRFQDTLADITIPLIAMLNIEVVDDKLKVI